MRITVLTNEYEPEIIGGLGVVATKLAQHLASLGNDIIVITKGNGRKVQDEIHHGVRIIRVPVSSKYHSTSRQLFFAKPIVSYLEESLTSLDAVHVHSVQMDELTRLLASRFGARTVYTCHSLIRQEGLHTHRHRAMHERQHALLRHVDTIISPSVWQARVLINRDRITPRRCRVIPGGVELTELPPFAPSTRLLYVGRLAYGKGLVPLIHAMPLLARKYHDIRLDIVGHGSPHRTRDLRRLVDRLHVTRRVRFLGAKPHRQVVETMNGYGAVVVPSRSESFGLVALEAMAAGTPLIATQAGGLRDFVDRRVASIISAQTPTAIRRAVSRCLKYTQQTKRKRERAHLRTARYSWERVATLYEEALSNAKEESV